MRDPRTPPDQRRQDQEQVLESDRSLTDVMDSLSDAVVVADARDLTVEYVNRGFQDVLGFEAAELEGKELVSLYPDEEGASAFREALQQALDERRPGFRSEQVFGRSDGSPIWVEMITRLVPDEEPERLICVIRDITERKLSEDALVQSHARLELLNSILSGVKLGMSVDEVIELTLARLSEYFSGLRVAYSRIDGTGKLVVTHSVEPEGMPSRVGATEDLNHAPDYLVAVRAGETVVVGDVEDETMIDGVADGICASGARAFLNVPMQHSDDLVALLCLDSPVPRVWSMHAIMTLSEVASHLGFVLKDAEAQKTRRHLEEQLRQSQKMEAVGRLAGGVAHDFNNILTGITGYAELALAEVADPGVRRDLEKIRQFSDRAASLTHQLLAFSRRQPLKVAAVNLNDLVKSIFEMVERLIGEDVELKFETGAELLPVRADAGQIEQVLMNLAVNSRDAMPDGGKLIIETANVHLDRSYASRHTAVIPGDYVMLSVSDTGCGIDEESQASIFEPFFTTKEQGKGTGLGLSTVYGIVKQHEGNIWVYSETDRGTCFKIYLPSFEGDAEKPAETVETAVVPRGSETVLLVEDEPRVRDAVQRALEKYGYRVLSATHPDEACDLFAEHSEEIDILLSDVVMPGYDGTQLYDNLRETHPDLPVLYMSGYTDRAVLANAILDPGMPFIQKPFAPAQLVRKVRAVLDDVPSPT